LQNLINEIINFLNTQAVAFSGWGVALVTAVVSLVVAIIKRHRKRKTSISEKINNTKSDGVYMKNADLVKDLQIKETMKTQDEFSDYKDFLLVQYGSSVSSDSTLPSDFDFIVLMLGYSKKEVKYMHNKGTVSENGISDSSNITHIDIVFRDYLSFLFAASIGMPYENSVIANGKLIHGHIGYYGWLENITKNILMDRDFLIRRFNDKIVTEKEEYIKCKNEMIKYGHHEYYVIRAGYYYITSILQREEIKKLDKVLNQKDISKLANVRNFYNSFSDSDIREKYINLVENLKRNTAISNTSPESIEAILTHINQLSERDINEHD